MGKRVRDKKHGVTDENNRRGTSISASASTSHHGRTWSILNIMKYHHWHLNVKKRLTHKKNGGGKNPEAVDGPSGADNMQDYDPNSKLSSVKEMAVLSNSPAKHSVKARLKALLTHEIARKKGQHRRSSTYPVKPKPPSQFVSIHNLDHSDPNLVSESILTENDPEMVPQASETFKDLPPACSTTNKEMCVLCGTMFSGAPTEHNSITVHKHQKPSSEYHRALMKETLSYEEKSIHAKLLTTDVSPYLFKDFLDALDMINSNKDLLLKFLQHQHSPLAYHSPNQQESTRKMKLNKSSSFPVRASSSSLLSSKVKEQDTSTMAGEIIRSREVQDGSQTQKAVTSQSESSEKSDLQPVSLDSYYNTSVPAKVRNPRAIKHFKDLRRKVKHVIEESKNENRHIAMDAVYHKVPHGNKPPKVDTISPSEFGSFKKRQISPMRTSSLNESVWKYSQLYETCFNKKYNYPSSDMLKLKTEEKNPILKPPKSFQRFLSLPNLKDYFNQNEEPSSILPPQIPIRKFGERDASLSTSIGNITTPKSDFKSVQKGIAIRRDSELVSDEDKESNQNESTEIDDYIGKLTDSEMKESTSIVAETKSISFSVSSFLDDSMSSDEKLSLTEDLKIKPWPIDGLDHLTEQTQELDIADYHELVVTGEYDFQKFGTMNKHLNSEIPGLEEDTNSVAEFNYVKDVLELSGLSTTRESLSSWFSNEQPVDPTVYDELEGCSLYDPESSGNEESGSGGGGGAHCNHLLLFDLINEVLIEIFGRSYSYYPKSLSSLCHVYPIPVGDQVVREVWALIKWYLNMNSDLYPSLDYYVSKDLARSDGWMNLQFDSECVGLEIDDLIFDDLLDEIISDELMRS